jgi:very-short-patch-repair endonuclease
LRAAPSSDSALTRRTTFSQGEKGNGYFFSPSPFGRRWLAAEGSETDEGLAVDTDRARKLRSTMTDAERRLWSGLRDRRLDGLKFRRQRQLGPYFVDFFCLEASLVVEADGAQHHQEVNAWYDYHRTKWLESAGYRVIRFANSDIQKYPAQVLTAIAEAAKKAH